MVETMKYKKAPGVEDIFPDKIGLWNHIIDSAKTVFRSFNFKEVVLPVMEFTEVFIRGIGDETDIVSKEMFTFEDRGGRSLTLRPEGTASLVRAFCENGDYNRLASAKLFYCGPMFRAEKPQKGRLRQFNQFGAELFGPDDPYYDFEAIASMSLIAENLGITEFTLLINSIGCDKDRPAYIEKLKEFYRENYDKLCENCKKRLEKNPLRILDCKEESCTALRSGAPLITDFLCDDCNDHHSRLKEHLDQAGISYTESAHLVRGLDYYTKTVFEFVTNKLGAQSAFAAGGRYNNLVEAFGGKPKPAVGFAAGVERLFLMMEESYKKNDGIHAYLVFAGENTDRKAFEIAYQLRKKGLKADLDPSGGSFKTQMKKMDREHALFAVIIGEDELSKGSATVKNSKTGEEFSVEFDSIADTLYSLIHGQ
jgi:histidyl-tRNA synthetase